MTYHKNYIPNCILKKELDENLLEMLGGIKHKNHCKFLMLVRAYNNHNLAKGDITDGEPYCWFTMKQAAGVLECSEMTIVRVVKYLYDLGYIKLLKDRNINKSNHVNFYLYNISEKVEVQKNIDLSELDITIAEPEPTVVEVYTPAEGKFEGDIITTNEARTFYDRIRIPGTKMEISDCKTVFPVDIKNRYRDICTHQCDTYFVGGVDTQKATRCSDMDIVQKKYFAIDIDIRQTIQKLTGEVISDNQLYGYIDEILRLLDESDFGDYDEVVMSGNGVHIYYIGEPRKFNKEVYKTAVTRIFECVDEIIAPLGLSTDKKVCNIASLFRCPGTANYKRQTKYGLDFGQAFVYKRQEGGGITFDSLEFLAAQVLSEQQEKVNQRKLVQNEVIVSRPRSKDGDIFEKINSIPVDSLFCGYAGAQMAKDGKNFISGKDGKNMGCFYNKDKNIIVNSGTHYLGNEKSYNTFNFVMMIILGLTHCKESINTTIKRFKENHNI